MSYSANASHHASEIFESLSEEDMDAIREDVEALGPEGWARWCVENRKAALDYLSATPAQRQKKKQWQDPVLRRRLSLHCYGLAKLAGHVLHAVSYLGSGGYRDNTGAAGKVALDIIMEGIWRWPFGPPVPAGWDPPRHES